MKAIAIAVGLTMLGAAGQARADVSEHDKAIAAFEEGRRYLESGNCDGAITKLRESVSHEPSIGARASLADCYERSDALAAWKQLRDAARLAFLVHDERLAVLEARAAQLEPRLPMVRVEGAGFDAPGFELRIDGDLVDPFLYRDRLIATTGGEHRLEALSPGRQWSSRVVAQAGNTTVATVDLQTRSPLSSSSVYSASGPAPATLGPAPGGAGRALAYTLGGVGIAGVGAGVAFGLVSLQKRSDLSTACGGDTTRCTAPAGSLDVARESAQSTGTVAVMGFVVGGAALAGAVVLYLASPSSRASAPAKGSVGVAPVVGKNQEGLSVVGRW